jgi:acetylornithine/N-succinyldiaminopimelate aminotransferase
LKIVDETKVLANIRERGAEMRQGLEALAKKFDFVREVRGEGLILGVELSINGASLVSSALQRGLLINCTHDFTIRLLPAFLISKAEVRRFLKIFEALLTEARERSSIAEDAGPHSQHAHAATR